MAESWTTRRLRGWISGFLGERGVDAPGVCADLLLGHVLGCDRMSLYMHADRPASAEELAQLRALVRRAAGHEPVQYLVGRWGFHGMDLEVDSSTLIPRPCTETLVESALAHLRGRGLLDAACDRPARVLDLCTGSGCIAIAIVRSAHAARRARRSLAWSASPGATASDAARHPQEDASAAPISVIATDIVPGAVALAQRNVTRHGLGPAVDVREGDLYSPVTDAEAALGFDVICANPPYVTADEWDRLDRNVREHEPITALVGGTDGLDVVRRVIARAPSLLASGGLLLCEIGASQGDQAIALAHAAGLPDASVIQDHECLPRVLRAQT
jgi:release factor glutamine methyltransferase